MKPKAILIDIDGTLADHRHRLHFVKPFGYSCDGTNTPRNCDGSLFKKNWPAFYEAMDKDTPYEWCVRIICGIMFEKPLTHWIFITGRPEKYRALTEQFLELTFAKHGIWFDQLYMRPDNDNTPSAQFKRQVYEREIKPEYDVIFVLEDDLLCARMYKEQGLTVLQVLNGTPLSGACKNDP